MLHAHSDTAKEIEILVLRHQLAMLQRGTARPGMNWTDRAVIALLAGLLPARRRLGLLVTPSTILREALDCACGFTSTSRRRLDRANIRELAKGSLASPVVGGG